MPTELAKAKHDALAVVRDYHQRSKHHLQRYAAGPGSLDWDHQPNPFRHFAGTTQFQFGLHADALPSTYQQLYTPNAIAPFALNSAHLGVFFELSFALTAWKQYGTARWSLRCNPSSGNLHPTEAYAVLLQHLDTLSAGIYHYCSDDHALEQRCQHTPSHDAPGFLLGLSTIAWREAWKYGERAFRYCQLDTGHAIACADYAAACLGWQTRLVDATDAQIATLLGLDRDDDFARAEDESPELLLWVTTANEDSNLDLSALTKLSKQGTWSGQANLLDPRPMYQWPVIDEVTQASEKIRHDNAAPWDSPVTTTHRLPADGINMAHLIRQRRSAQAYDGQTSILSHSFLRLLSSLLPYTNTPVWRSWYMPARIQPVFFVHRVEGLTPGLYIQVRDPRRTNYNHSSNNWVFITWSVPTPRPRHASMPVIRTSPVIAPSRWPCWRPCTIQSMMRPGTTASFTGNAACLARSCIWRPRPVIYVAPASVVSLMMPFIRCSAFRMNSGSACISSPWAAH